MISSDFQSKNEITNRGCNKIHFHWQSIKLQVLLAIRLELG